MFALGPLTDIHARALLTRPKSQELLKFRVATFRRRRHREISGPIDLEIYRRASKAGFARTRKASVIGKKGLIMRLTSQA
jgi:hypothetical protein